MKHPRIGRINDANDDFEAWALVERNCVFLAVPFRMEFVGMSE